MLQVSAKSIYRWSSADPTMPALRIGGALRFHRERLDRWLREKEQGVARQRPSQKQVRSRGQAGQVVEITEHLLADNPGVDAMGQSVGQKARQKA